jgi:UDP-N-acetylmuramoyl-tripeptide--D-alanyl-D-alanine ligase
MSGLIGTGRQLRLILIPGEGGCYLLDDSYESTVDSALAALNLFDGLRDDFSGRKVAVLGDLHLENANGDELERLVGRRASEVADVVVGVGPGGRRIAQAAGEIADPQVAVHLAADPMDAVHILRRVIVAGDTVLVKGERALGMQTVVEELANE